MTTDYFQTVRRDGAAAVNILSSLDDINVRNEDGQNLLHHAIAYGNDAATSELLRRGIDVNTQDSKGQTPLHYAAAYGNAEVASEILKRGGDLTIVDSHGNTAIWTAVFNARGRYAVLEELVRHGGDRVAMLKNKHGRSPIDFATQINDVNLLRLLRD